MWAPFDREDPLEWILIGFGIGALVVLVISRSSRLDFTTVVLVAMFLLYMYYSNDDNNKYG